MEFDSTISFLVEKIVFPLLGLIWWGMNRRLESCKKELELVKKELKAEIEANHRQVLKQNANQYEKIYGQDDKIAKMGTHIAENFLMKTDFDRVMKDRK